MGQKINSEATKETQNLSKFVSKQILLVEIAKKSLILINEQEFFDFVCKEVSKLFNSNSTGILRYDIVTNKFIFVAKYDVEIEDPLTIIQNQPDYISGYTFLKESPVSYDEIKHNPKFLDSPLMKLFSISSGLSCTIKTKRGKWGIFGSMSLHENQITLKDSDFFQNVADIIGSFLERKDNEKEILNANVIKIVTSLTAEISHDFNNYLSVISGYVDQLQNNNLMQRKFTNDEKSNILSKISNTITKSRELVKLIQSAGKNNAIKQTKLDINKIIIDMKEIFDQKVKAINDKKIKVELYLTDEAPVLIKGDPTQLSQLLLNLVTNAIEASKPIGLIKISTRNILISNPENSFEIASLGLFPCDYLHLCITDNGIGIEKEFLTNIFTPYISGKKLSSASGTNFGLGLSIVFNIIKQMKGDIKVFSEVNKGTMFNIYLPSSE